jgi:hypothetical protein
VFRLHIALFIIVCYSSHSLGSPERLVMASKYSEELENYQNVLNPSHNSPRSNGDSSSDRIGEDLKMVPLVWWKVKEQLPSSFEQYAVLGHEPKGANEETNVRAEEDDAGENNDTRSKSSKLVKPILLNTNSPWSVFLCGSQGSGKSHTLSCMLENCLMNDNRIGNLPNPLAGLVFHYDSSQSSGVCEAASLCSDISTTVLVPPSNYENMKKMYMELPSAKDDKIKVKQLHLLPKHLNTDRLKTLMAVGKEGEMPLYMHVSQSDITQW